jgi:hypothetical protein
LPRRAGAGTYRAVRTRPLAALLLLLAAPAGAAPPAPPTVADLTGVRSASLGGARGLAGGNEGIFLNAASLAARRRYALETHWTLERAGGANAGQFFTLSAVDSQLSAVTGGFAYTRVVSGPSVGNAYHLALATRLGGKLFVGVTGKYLSLSGAEDVGAATVDASAYVPIGGLLSVGVAGYNLVPVGHDEQAPRGLGTGVALGDGRRFNLTGDWRRDFDRAGGSTDAWGAGAELLLGNHFPVRAGWLRDETRDGPTRDAQWWSAGAGFVTTAGAAIDLLYRQVIGSPSDRTFGVALKLLILQ